MSKTMAVHDPFDSSGEMSTPSRVSFNPKNGTLQQIIESIGIAWRTTTAINPQRNLRQFEEWFTAEAFGEDMPTRERGDNYSETTILYPDDVTELVSQQALRAYRELGASYDYDVAQVEEDQLQVGQHLRW